MSSLLVASKPTKKEHIGSLLICGCVRKQIIEEFSFASFGEMWRQVWWARELTASRPCPAGRRAAWLHLPATDVPRCCRSLEISPEAVTACLNLNVYKIKSFYVLQSETVIEW